MFTSLIRFSRIRKYMINVLWLWLEFTNAWVHTIFIFFGLGYLLWIVFLFPFIFKQNSRCYFLFFPLSSTLISRSITISLFILPLTGCLQVFAITNNTLIYRVEQMLLLDYWASLGYLPKSGIAGSLGQFTPNFLRYSHSVFQSCCITLQTHQQEMSVSLTPHTLQ